MEQDCVVLVQLPLTESQTFCQPGGLLSGRHIVG